MSLSAHTFFASITDGATPPVMQLSSLAVTNSTLLGFDGSGNLVSKAFTTIGTNLLAAASAAAGRSTLSAAASGANTDITSLALGNGLVGTPSLSFASDPDTGIYSGGANIIGFTAGGSAQMSVTSTGVQLLNVPTAPTAGSGNNTTQLATTAFVQSAISTAVTGVWKIVSGLDCSANPNYPAGIKGDLYYVTVAGKIGGASGVVVSVGDNIVCLADNAGGTQASVGASWNVTEANIPGITTLGTNLITLANPGAVSFIRINADNSASTRTASQFRGDLGATTVGGNFFALANPGVISFPRINADNSVSTLSFASFKAVIAPTVNSFDGDATTPWGTPNANYVGDMMWNIANGDLYALVLAGGQASQVNWSIIGKKYCLPRITLFGATIDTGGGAVSFVNGGAANAGDVLLGSLSETLGYPAGSITENSWFRMDGSNGGLGTSISNPRTIIADDEGYTLQFRATVTNTIGAATQNTTTAIVPYNQHLLTHIVGYWKLDESSGDRVNQTGGADFVENGSVGGDPAVGPASLGSAVFIGTSDFLAAAGVTLRADTSKPVTIAFWFDVSAGAGAVLHSGNGRFDISISGGGGLTVTLYSAGGLLNVVAGYGTGFATPYLAVIKFYESAPGSGLFGVNLNIYDAGGSTVGTADSGTTDFNGDGGCAINALDTITMGTGFSGHVDDVGIWNKELNSVELAAIKADTQYASFVL